MRSRNATILAQTRYFARHLHRVVREVMSHPQYRRVVEYGVPKLFKGPLIPAVVGINGYIAIHLGENVELRDSQDIELFLESDPNESRLFAQRLGRDYHAVSRAAMDIAQSFQQFEDADFRRLWEITLAGIKALQQAPLAKLSSDLEHLYLNADAFAEFSELP